MMKTFDQLAEEVKHRELSSEEVTYIIQQVKELTITHGTDLPHWTYLLGFVKEYQGFEAVVPEEYNEMVEKTIKDFRLLATYCPSLESISLGMPDDKVLIFLDLFPKLLRFCIDSACCITDKGVENIWRLSQLTYLGLHTYRGVDDVFIENLCRLDKLTDLNLDGCDYVFDHDLKQLTNLTHLRSLNLGASVRVTDEGIPYIITMKNLVFLDLGATRVSDQGILALSALPKLKKLLLSRCNITNEGLKDLASMKNLEFVDLSECENITDKGILHLKNIGTLKIVDLSYCENITEQGIKGLLPQIQVIRRNRKK
ncbi:MAG: hypothetical protein H0T62_11320 [Parachlamydiaceae bacterium]|nr:hypothetical protein [Parachlamydiaceae bacterium]